MDQNMVFAWVSQFHLQVVLFPIPTPIHWWVNDRYYLLQYMPNKRPARFGIKKFPLCDDNGFVMHVEIYAGKDIDLHQDEGDGQAVAVVKRLLSEACVLNKGFKIYTDNFYTKLS